MNASTDVQQDFALTEKAAHQIRKIMEDEKITDDYKLRVGIQGGGCSGMTYKMGFDQAQKENDTEIQSNGISIIIDPKSLFYLTGTTLDFSDGLNAKGFVFQNPNAARSCGCGESFGV